MRGVRFLIDPMLAVKGAYPGFEGTANSELRNPLVHMPFPVEDVIDVDAVIVTHQHPDHWDAAAKSALPKSMPVFAQNETDASPNGKISISFPSMAPRHEFSVLERVR